MPSCEPTAEEGENELTDPVVDELAHSIPTTAP